MQKSPFKLYDFLGYAFSGALVLLGILVSWDLSSLHSNDVIQLRQFVESAIKIFKAADWCNMAIFVFFAYLIGHVVSYLSSMTVEKLAIFLYGYPSEFLLGQTKDPTEHYNNNPISERQSIAILLVLIVLLPLIVCEWILGYQFRLRLYLLKPVDEQLQKVISDKIVRLIEKLQLTIEWDEDMSANSDFHRIAHHYVYSKGQYGSAKLDNYVALYGFNRAICFLLNTAFIVFAVFMASGVIELNAILLFTLQISCYVFFMSFMKFYRRYSLENFMELIVDTSLTNDSKSQISISYHNQHFVGSGVLYDRSNSTQTDNN